MNEAHKRRAIRDCIHLSTHKIYSRDFFITRDNQGILKNKEKLKEKYNLIVISPEEFLKLEEIKSMLSN